MKFECSSCGACCLQAGKFSPELARSKDNMVCKNLNDETRMCNVYDDRPDMCRVDYKLHEKQYASEKEYLEANVQGCKTLIDAYGIGEEYYPAITNVDDLPKNS